MPCPATKCAAVLLIETDSISVIGPISAKLSPRDLPNRPNLGIVDRIALPNYPGEFGMVSPVPWCPRNPMPGPESVYLSLSSRASQARAYDHHVSAVRGETPRTWAHSESVKPPK